MLEDYNEFLFIYLGEGNGEGMVHLGMYTLMYRNKMPDFHTEPLDG